MESGSIDRIWGLIRVSVRRREGLGDLQCSRLGGGFYEVPGGRVQLVPRSFQRLLCAGHEIHP